MQISAEQVLLSGTTQRPAVQGSALGTCTHSPVVALQLSVLHSLPSEQLFATPRHTPPLQTSPVVHGSPSSHGEVLLTIRQPVSASQRAEWQGLESPAQVMLAPRQRPTTQTSFVVQREPSSHTPPSLVGECAHTPVSSTQVSTVLSEQP